MENVTLTQREQARLQVLNSLLAEHMTLDQAATLMGVSTRHTRRILAAYREEGAGAGAGSGRIRRAISLYQATAPAFHALCVRTSAGTNDCHPTTIPGSG